ncbi:MAG: SDR family oxidoreductase [Flavobacteriales bacterium]
MKILITGSNGLLGQKLVAQLLKSNVNFLATSLGPNRNVDCPQDKYLQMNICDSAEIESVFEKYQPTHVIHTAAMTNVDACELDPEACQKVNVSSVHLLAEACAAYSCHFQLLSTDFVFDGVKGNYSEEDEPNPLSVYAHSKVDAEKCVQQFPELSFSIVRTIIVYGTGNQLSRSNIVLWAREALKNGQELSIIDDQFRAPTWADDLAWACIRICTMNQTGIFHICGPETMSIYELVQRIAKHDQLPMEQVIRTDSSTLNQPAKRPPRTGFNLEKAQSVLGYAPKSLEETLDCL